MAVPKTTKWALDPHTVAKHEILRRYLGGWFPILTHGGFNPRVVFLDGFAGPGVYSAGENGSPLIALETLVSHHMFDRLSHTEFVLFFVEQDPERFASLGEQVAGFWAAHGGQPENVRVEMVNGEFAEVADGLLSSLEEAGKNLAPTFAFVDPFGFKGVPFSIFERIARYPKCEVFFNFMYDSLNRWITHPQESIHVHLSDLFGTEEYRDADGLAPAERKAFLHDLYARQLTEGAGLEFVQSFEMIGMSGHTTYSLFYGTRNLTGLKVMKDAMWKLDPIEGGRFSDRLAGVEVLFEAEPDLEPLRQALLSHFAGKDAAVPAIERFVLVNTPFSASHYKKGALAHLQREGVIEAVSGQNRRFTFPDQVVVRFPPNP